MITKWRIVKESTLEYPDRQKIMLSGDKGSVREIVEEVRETSKSTLCGMVYSVKDDEYSSFFYLYYSSEEEQKSIKKLLSGEKEATETEVEIEKITDKVVEEEPKLEEEVTPRIKITRNEIRVEEEVAAEKGLAEEAREKEPSEIEVKKEVKPVEDLREKFGIDSKCMFENFLIGESNHFAQVAALCVAELPGKVYNPLFVWGEEGLGKTHLLQAIGNFVLEHNPEAQIFYIDGEEFLTRAIKFNQEERVTRFRDRFQELDLLLIDDVQLLSGSEAAQEEFFYLFNYLYDHHKQLVISSTVSPQKIPLLEERLRTRFEWGLIAELQTPDLELRLNILKGRFEQAEVPVSEEVLTLICQHLENTGKIISCGEQIINYFKKEKKEISPEFVKELINKLYPEEPQPVKKVEGKTVTGQTPLSHPPEKNFAVSMNILNIAYIYPEGRDEELRTMQENFLTVLRKHHIKFRVETCLEKGYAPDNLDYETLASFSKSQKADLVMVLTPPQDFSLSEHIFMREMKMAFEKEVIPVQFIPFNDVARQYRYLNIALDVVFLKRA